MRLNPLFVLNRTALAVFLAAAFPAAQAANVVVTPGGVAGYMYLTPEESGGSTSSTPPAMECVAALTKNYTKTFVAGEVTSDLVISYWMAGGGGGGGRASGGDGARINSSFTVPAGYTGTVKVFVGYGGQGAVNNAGGAGGAGYAGGGGGGRGYHTCSGCVPAFAAGGGGGSSAILMDASRIAIAGGGGGGGGVKGGNGVGASGGGGGGTSGTPPAASDVKSGIWNKVDPVVVGGAGNGWASQGVSWCGSLPTVTSGPGSGGTNGGGGGGGGSGWTVWQNTFLQCVYAYDGGGGGGGGAGGGGGGAGSDSPVEFKTTTGAAGGWGGGLGAAGGNAPDLIAHTSYQYGGTGGIFSGVGGKFGSLYANNSSLIPGPGTYVPSDPLLFLADKGLGGASVGGTSGGVYLKYMATSCPIQPPL